MWGRRSALIGAVRTTTRRVTRHTRDAGVSGRPTSAWARLTLVRNDRCDNGRRSAQLFRTRGRRRTISKCRAPRRPVMPHYRSLFLSLLIAAAPIAASAAPADFASLVNIGGGREMYLECRGAGVPAVVIVAGGKASADDWTFAAPGAANVFSGVAGFTRVCAYDRPGTPVGQAPSRSDRVPSRPPRPTRSPTSMRCWPPPASRRPWCSSGIPMAASSSGSMRAPIPARWPGWFLSMP